MISAEQVKLYQVVMPINFKKVKGKIAIPDWLWDDVRNLMLSASFWYMLNLYEKRGSLIIDSGGFQFGGKQKRDRLKEFFSLRESLYRWQCMYADYIIGGDIPISLTKDFEFIKKCLLMTMDNMDLQFKLGAEGRFVNVMHGHSPEVLRYWYKGVKGFPSVGWSLGSALKTAVCGFALQFLTLMELGEFEKRVKIIHCLGATSPEVVIGVHYILDQIGIETDILSFDSSSSSAERFGGIIDETGEVISFSEVRSGERQVKLWDGNMLTDVPAVLRGKTKFDISRTNMTNTSKVWEKKMLGMIREKNDDYFRIAEQGGAVPIFEIWKEGGVDTLYKELVRIGKLKRVVDIENKDEFSLV